MQAVGLTTATTATRKTKCANANSRYSKALIAVGPTAWRDKSLGLETELVALHQPYPLARGIQQMESRLPTAGTARRGRFRSKCMSRTASKDVTVTNTGQTTRDTCISG